MTRSSVAVTGTGTPATHDSTSLVVVPTYNERDNVCRLAEAVLQASPDSDILFVDDDSPDGTGQLLDEMSAAGSRLFVLHRSEKRGAAYASHSTPHQATG